MENRVPDTDFSGVGPNLDEQAQALGAMRMPAMEGAIPLPAPFSFLVFIQHILTEHCSGLHAVLGMGGRGKEQDRRVCMDKQRYKIISETDRKSRGWLGEGEKGILQKGHEANSFPSLPFVWMTEPGELLPPFAGIRADDGLLCRCLESKEKDALGGRAEGSVESQPLAKA